MSMVAAEDRHVRERVEQAIALENHGDEGEPGSIDESSVNCSNTQKDAAMVAIYLHHLITERIDWRSIDHAVRSDRLEHFWDAVSQSAPNSFNSTGNSYTSNIELDRTGIRTLSAL